MMININKPSYDTIDMGKGLLIIYGNNKYRYVEEVDKHGTTPLIIYFSDGEANIENRVVFTNRQINNKILKILKCIKKLDD